MGVRYHLIARLICDQCGRVASIERDTLDEPSELLAALRQVTRAEGWVRVPGAAGDGRRYWELCPACRPGLSATLGKE